MQYVEIGNNLELTFDYHPKIVEAVRNIPGRRWNPDRKAWIVPRSEMATVQFLMQKYGGAQKTAKPEEYGAIPELPELTVDIPLQRTPFPFQKKGIAAGLQFKRFINGDQPGLGKTTQAIATVVAANAFPCLIICPSTLKINWEREWMTVAGMKAMVLNDRVKNTWPTYYKVGMVNVFITNYESLKKYFVHSINKPTGVPLKLKHVSFRQEINAFKAVVIDELHKCKDGSTQQAKLTMGIARDKEWIIGLTGTPVVNKPKDLISQLYIINRLQEFGGYKAFMDRYCGGNGSGATNLKELNYKLASTCFFQRRKQEVLKELPDKMRQIVLCEINTRREYDAALADLAGYLKVYKEKSDPEIERSMRGELMVKIGVCKNIAARGKIHDVIEHIDEVVGAGEKIVVFIHQKEIARALLDHYPAAVSITGEVTGDNRQKAVDAFQEDPNTRIIVCSMKAAGVGLTLTASSRVLFVELPWHAADADQCEDRCHRIGQKGSVQCTYMLGKDTIDEDIYKIIETKREIANEVTGSVDNIQKEIIDKIASSLFSEKE